MATPIRTVRIEDDLWSRATEAAAEFGTDVSTVIRFKLEEWLTAVEEEDE